MVYYVSVERFGSIECVKARSRRCKALVGLGRLGDALEEITKAKDIDPSNKEICNQFDQVERIIVEYLEMTLY